MKFTPADLDHIVTELTGVVTEEDCPLHRLLAFFRSELADVIETGPDTIELYFTNRFRLPGQNRANPFERRDYSTIKTAGGKL